MYIYIYVYADGHIYIHTKKYRWIWNWSFLHIHIYIYVHLDGYIQDDALYLQLGWQVSVHVVDLFLKPTVQHLVRLVLDTHPNKNTLVEAMLCRWGLVTSRSPPIPPFKHPKCTTSIPKQQQIIFNHLWISTSTLKYLQMSTNIYKHLQISTAIYRYLKISTNVYKCLQISTNIYKHLQIPAYELSGSTDIYKFSLTWESLNLGPKVCLISTYILTGLDCTWPPRKVQVIHDPRPNSASELRNEIF